MASYIDPTIESIAQAIVNGTPLTPFQQRYLSNDTFPLLVSMATYQNSNDVQTLMALGFQLQELNHPFCSLAIGPQNLVDGLDYLRNAAWVERVELKQPMQMK